MLSKNCLDGLWFGQLDAQQTYRVGKNLIDLLESWTFRKNHLFSQKVEAFMIISLKKKIKLGSNGQNHLKIMK